MTYVYVLKSLNRNYIYVGLSNNYNVRVESHQKGQNKTTKPYRPFQLILVEKFLNRSDAREREKFLKSGSGKEWIKAQSNQCVGGGIGRRATLRG